jgi:FkbM family methyltransferase
MLRVKLIQAMIQLNELIYFYPKLKGFYRKNIAFSNPVIVDVGANKGQTIDFFLRLFKDCTIYSFEPNRQLFERLQHKYRASKNVHIFNYGISDKNGKLLFHESILNETSTFEELNYDSSYLKRKAKVLGVQPANVIRQAYEVEVITLADFIEQQKIHHIDVLKIDTEGHEFKCLLGLFKTNAKYPIQFIQLEEHNDDMYKNKISEDEMSNLLEQNDFVLFEKIEHGFGDFHELIYGIL